MAYLVLPEFLEFLLSKKLTQSDLSITNDGRRPVHRRRRIEEKPWVDGKAEHEVEVVDDAGHHRDDQHEEDETPKTFPAFALGQREVVKSVRWRPQIESWNKTILLRFYTFWGKSDDILNLSGFLQELGSFD